MHSRYIDIIDTFRLLSNDSLGLNRPSITDEEIYRFIKIAELDLLNDLSDKVDRQEKHRRWLAPYLKTVNVSLENSQYYTSLNGRIVNLADDVLYLILESAFVLRPDCDIAQAMKIRPVPYDNILNWYNDPFANESEVARTDIPQGVLLIAKAGSQLISYEYTYVCTPVDDEEQEPMWRKSEDLLVIRQALREFYNTINGEKYSSTVSWD